MKNLKKLNRESLRDINGGAGCAQDCPVGPYGPEFSKSCADFEALPECCKLRVLVSSDCFPR